MKTHTHTQKKKKKKKNTGPRHEKTNNVVSKQICHKPSCTSTEDGLQELYYPCSANNGSYVHVCFKVPDVSNRFLYIK